MVQCSTISHALRLRLRKESGTPPPIGIATAANSLCSSLSRNILYIVSSPGCRDATLFENLKRLKSSHPTTQGQDDFSLLSRAMAMLFRIHIYCCDGLNFSVCFNYACILIITMSCIARTGLCVTIKTLINSFIHPFIELNVGFHETSMRYSLYVYIEITVLNTQMVICYCQRKKVSFEHLSHPRTGRSTQF